MKLSGRRRRERPQLWIYERRAEEDARDRLWRQICCYIPKGSSLKWPDDDRVHKQMSRLLWADEKITVTTTHYHQGMQKNTSSASFKQHRKPWSRWGTAAKNRKIRLQFTWAHQNCTIDTEIVGSEFVNDMEALIHPPHLVPNGQHLNAASSLSIVADYIHDSKQSLSLFSWLVPAE